MTQDAPSYETLPLSVHIDEVLVQQIRHIVQRIILLKGPVLRCTRIFQLNGLTIFHLVFCDHGLVDNSGALSKLLAAFGVSLVQVGEVEWDKPVGQGSV